MNYYISRNYKGLNSAGNKAKSDIEGIVERTCGFRNAGLPLSTYTNTVVHFVMNLAGVLKAPFCLRKGDVLLLQYPLKKYYAFVCNMAHLRGAKVVTLIHDLGSFRRKALTVEQEIKRLNHSDFVIAHNDKMKKWLLDNGCKAQLSSLGIFDYVSKSPLPKNEIFSSDKDGKKEYVVVYAGALAQRKNAFLYEWGDYISTYKVALYGSNFDVDSVKGKEHFIYNGFVKSDDFISSVKGHFGLVWDGASMESCTGNFGEYLKLNNPHKTSFYIRSGLPVIIWRQAALADFVESHGIGVCIDSLIDLDKLHERISVEDYQRMKDNVLRESKLLQEGHYASTAVKEVLDKMNKQ